MSAATPNITNIQTDVAGAAAAIVSEMKAAGIAQGENLESFAQEQAPEYARLSALLAAAKLAGDAIGAQRYDLDIASLNAAAVLAAAAAGINVEAASELAFLGALNTVVGLLVSAAVKAA